jgi:hypothetical protein
MLSKAIQIIGAASILTAAVCMGAFLFGVANAVTSGLPIIEWSLTGFFICAFVAVVLAAVEERIENKQMEGNR